MKIKLNIADRFILLSLLPEQGDIHLLRVTADARRLIGFTDEELVLWRIGKVSGTDQYQWNVSPGVEAVVEIELGDAVAGLLRDALKTLSDRRQLTPTHVAVYERFVEGKE